MLPDRILVGLLHGHSAVGSFLPQMHAMCSDGLYSHRSINKRLSDPSLASFLKAEISASYFISSALLNLFVVIIRFRIYYEWSYMIVKESVFKLDSCVLVRTVLHSFAVLFFF